MKYPVQIIKANVETHDVKVLNKQTLNAFVYIEIPKYIAQDCVLYAVSEVCPKFVAIPDYNEFISIHGDKNYPWLDVASSRLNQSVGTHVYELEYVNPDTNATFSLYFAYILQDNDPEKPYIYMQRED